MFDPEEVQEKVNSVMEVLHENFTDSQIEGAFKQMRITRRPEDIIKNIATYVPSHSAEMFTYLTMQQLSEFQ